MNKDKWNSISAANQKIIEQINQEWAVKHGEAWDTSDAQGIVFFLNQGSEIIGLDAKEGEKWKKAVAPIITVDWEAESGQRWKVPFGAGAGKLMFWGKLPVNLHVGAYTYVEKPDIGPDWQARVQVQVLLPTPGGGS